MMTAQSWNLVWSDEFTGPGISSSNWTFEQGGGGWGNNELEYYTARPQNATIDNGNLLIIARKESYGGYAYTSARMKTENLHSFMYGRIEARMKLPAGQGLWPAFWMLGNSITQVGWPKCGEIDIMEHINTTTVVNGTIHWDNNGHAQYGGTTPCDVTAYHVYAIEWNANSIVWFVDSQAYWVANIANNVNSTDEFHAPFFVLLNFALGGNWPGNPDVTTSFPDTVFVDYVRVYQLSTGVTPQKGSTPQESRLDQNFPNPFNPSTQIQYQVGLDAYGNAASSDRGELPVKLAVYDALGRETAVLVNGEQRPGIYSVTFDGSRHASGVYLCRLMTGTRVESREMVLLR